MFTDDRYQRSLSGLNAAVAKITPLVDLELSQQRARRGEGNGVAKRGNTSGWNRNLISYHHSLK